MKITIRQVSWLRAFCGSFAILLGGIVMLGWHAENTTLTQLHSTFVPMAYNTALAFITAGLGLLFIEKKYLPMLMGFIVFLLGGLTFAQFIFDVDHGIDRIFFPNSGSMAPNTALCFAISGVCLILASLKSRLGASEVMLVLFSFLIFLLGCIAFLGYILAVPSTYGWGSFTAMAIHTSFGFVVLGLGLIFYGMHNYSSMTKNRFELPSAFTLIIGIVLSLSLWQYLVLREERDVLRSVGITQKYLGDYVRDIIQKEEFILFEVLFDFSHEPGMVLTQKISDKVHQGYPLVAGLATIDPNNNIVWGIDGGSKTARDQVEKEIIIHPDAEGVDTQPIEVANVGRGFIMKLPYYENDVYQGTVFSVYNSDELFSNLLSASMLNNFGVSIYEEGVLIYQNVDINDEAKSRDWVQIESLSTGGSTWELHTWPRSKLIREIYSWAPNAVLVVTLFLSIMLAVIVQLGINLRKSNKMAQQASKAKSDFLSSMSHELRTPLNAIMGYAQLLEYDKDLKQAEKENAGKIHSAGKHLLSLINDVLDLSKIEAGKIEISVETISLEAIVTECYTLTLPISRKFGVELEFRDFKTDLYVKADYFRLKQVFLNLISNAVKYNRKGGNVKIITEKRKQDTLKIGIQDTGNGMSEEQIKNLFQPFQRFAAEKSNIEGTGIGLVITKELVEKMHGKIFVESDVGEGTTFWIELHLGDKADHASSVLAQQVQEVNSLDSDTAKHFTILVAEDNPANQEVIAQQLEYLGYKYKIVANGEEAYSEWLNKEYDLILMDCNMPKMDGYEATKEIRNDEENKDMHVPIVAFTANALKEDIKKCIDSGMDDYLTKPVELEPLQIMLAKQLGQKVKEADMSKNAPEAAAGAVDFSAIEKFVGDNKEVQAKILAKFLDSCPEIKGEISQAGQGEDAEEVRAHAHKLKSSARAVGANKLADLCLDLENAGKAGDWGKIKHLTPEVEGSVEETCALIKEHIEGG